MGTEKFWWAGVAAWVLMALYWQPEPPVSFAEVPSVVPYPKGYRIFHDLLKRQGVTVHRTLRKAPNLPKDLQVLAMLDPSEGISDKERLALLKWVGEDGGTLIVGHPLYREEGGRLQRFEEDLDGHWNTTPWTKVEEKLYEISCSPVRADPPREVPSFHHVLWGQMKPDREDVSTLASDANGVPVVTLESLGAGTLVQLSDPRILNNEAIGFRKTHLFAAALIDEVGRDKVWGFDEAHEGVELQPAIGPLVGSSRYRFVFLHGLLLLFFLYWWRSARFGAPRNAPDTRQVREVTTQCRDIGDFYFRTRKSRWALSRFFEYFRFSAKIGSSRARTADPALELAAEVEQALLKGTDDMEQHAALIRKMATHQRMLSTSSKGKKR